MVSNLVTGSVNEECTVFMSGLPFTTKESDIENALSEAAAAVEEVASQQGVADQDNSGTPSR